MSLTNADLRQFILKTFSDEELETLCFDYFPEVMAEFGGGMSQNRKAILLIGHCERRGRMDDLRAALARERAEAWQDAFSPLVETFRRNVSTPIPTRDPRQIFLSHATADAAFAHRLADDLRAEGWRVWIAPESIRAGEKWVEAIDRGLEESGAFVVVLTPNAVASRWVRTETSAAISMEHRDLIRFLPLDIAECRPPWTWTQYQYVSFRDSYEAGLGDLLAQLDEGQTAPTDVSPPVTPAPLPPSTPAPPDRYIHEKTGIELIRIPAGPFLFGDDNKTVELPEYWIGRYPVTNAQYKRFVDATGHEAPDHWQDKAPPPDKLDHPVVFISWHDAQALAEWAGLRLPTEQEWEKAARGTDGRRYPWGNEGPTAERCNFNKNVGDTTPVGKYSPKGDSSYDCADMAGNVWEWTASLYDVKQNWRVLKGGSYATTDASWLRGAYRDGGYPGDADGDYGARLAVSPSS